MKWFILCSMIVFTTSGCVEGVIATHEKYCTEFTPEQRKVFKELAGIDVIDCSKFEVGNEDKISG